MKRRRRFDCDAAIERYFVIRQATPGGIVQLAADGSRCTIDPPAHWLIDQCEVGCALARLSHVEWLAVYIRWFAYLEQHEAARTVRIADHAIRLLEARAAEARLWLGEMTDRLRSGGSPSWAGSAMSWGACVRSEPGQRMTGCGTGRYVGAGK